MLGPALDARARAHRPARPDRAAAPRAARRRRVPPPHRTRHAAAARPRWPTRCRASRATSSLGNHQFFLNVAMVAAKVATAAAAGVPGSALVTVVARNGVEVGVKLSGTGDRVVHRAGGAARPGPPRAGLRRPRTCSATSATPRSSRSTASARSPSRRRRSPPPRSGSTPPTRRRSRRGCGGSPPAEHPELGCSAAARRPGDPRRRRPRGRARRRSCRRSTPASRTARRASARSAAASRCRRCRPSGRGRRARTAAAAPAGVRLD